MPASTERHRILAVDTDVLVHWAMAGTAHHAAARRLISAELGQGRRLGLTLPTIHELVHVVTDGRRFERPLGMADALELSLELWTARDVERLLAPATAHERLCELMRTHRLGRKRIHDTLLAVTLEAAGVSRLATLNGRDFGIFPFLDVIDPTSSTDDD